MKNTILISILATLLLSSCSVNYRQIGDVNMISVRNVDNNVQYKLLASYKGADKITIKKSNFNNIEQAINSIVGSVPGGEIMKNVKVYLVDNKYIAVSGDVWGKMGITGFQGFEIGSKVLYNKEGNYYNAEIISFKNAEECMIKRYVNNGSKGLKEVIESVAIKDLSIKSSDKKKVSNSYEVGDKVQVKVNSIVCNGEIAEVINNNTYVVNYDWKKPFSKSYESRTITVNKRDIILPVKK